MRRTPTRPWEVRNAAAAARWAWARRAFTTERTPTQPLDSETMGRLLRNSLRQIGPQSFYVPVHPENWRRYFAPLRNTDGYAAVHMGDDIRKACEEIRQETNRLMGLYPRTAATQHDLDVLLARELSLIRVVGDDT